MAKRIKILWIEDSARYELAELVGPVYASRQYFMTLAEDASKAVELLLTNEFDAVILDIRLPPGNHKTWSALYQQAGNDKIRAGLGLHLLRWMFDPQRGYSPSLNELPPPPGWLAAERVAVFTAEHPAAVENALGQVKIKKIQTKTSIAKDTVLLDLLQGITNQGVPRNG
jgi:CheY-like chemotaxis protein